MTHNILACRSDRTAQECALSTNVILAFPWAPSDLRNPYFSSSAQSRNAWFPDQQPENAAQKPRASPKRNETKVARQLRETTRERRIGKRAWRWQEGRGIVRGGWECVQFYKPLVSNEARRTRMTTTGREKETGHEMGLGFVGQGRAAGSGRAVNPFLRCLLLFLLFYFPPCFPFLSAHGGSL